MAEIRRFFVLRHFRAESNTFVLHYRGQRELRRGQGLSFWFLPLSDRIVEVPYEDREIDIVLNGRSLDFQDVRVQGVVSYRVIDPTKLANRVDFSVDLCRGTFLKQPLDRISQFLQQLAQQYSWEYLAKTPVHTVLSEGPSGVRDAIDNGLRSAAELDTIGLQLLSVRVSAISGIPDLEKALEAPTREKI